MKPSTQELLLQVDARRTAIGPAKSEEAQELVRLGLAEVAMGRAGQGQLQLTALGKKVKQELVGGKKRKTAASLQDLAALEERIVLRIAKLIDAKLAQIEPRLRTMPPAHESEALTIDDLGARVLGAIQELDQARHLDGIVPLGLLRTSLSDVAATVLDRALVELERQYQIDLKIANDPSTVASPESGIRLPGRGLAYYAALR